MSSASGASCSVPLTWGATPLVSVSSGIREWGEITPESVDIFTWGRGTTPLRGSGLMSGWVAAFLIWIRGAVPDWLSQVGVGTAPQAPVGSFVWLEPCSTKQVGGLIQGRAPSLGFQSALSLSVCLKVYNI